MSNPDFTWSAFYYAEILAALIQFKSQAWPEHTEVDPHDPVIQLLRLFALVGHQQAVRADHIAREQYLPTLRLRSSLIALASLVDYQLAPPTPAVVDVLGDVSSGLSASTTIVRSLTRFATEGSGADPAIIYEYLPVDALELTLASGAYGFGSYRANTTTPQGLEEVQNHTGAEAAALLFDSATGDLQPANRCGLLFFHPQLQFDRISVQIDTPSADITGIRWEYYDDSRITRPGGGFGPAVDDLGGTIRLNVTTLCGSVNGSDGLDVLVICLLTGVQEWLQTTTVGINQLINTTGTLGQTTVSTNPADYSVQTFWPELPNLTDETGGLASSGDVTWSLPQAEDRRWVRTTLADVANNDLGPAYFIRARIVFTTGGTTPPVLDASQEPDDTVWTAMVEATQGRTFTERVGVTDGSASQAFTLPRTPLISLTQVLLSDGEWTRVDNFLSSTTFDRHFTLIEQPDGSQLLTFGDGANGKIPPFPSPVDVTYRVGGDQGGNVGPGAIVRDRTGNSRLRNVRNPRAASGWVVQEATTDQSLDQSRVAIPASLRALGRAVTPEDMEQLAIAFRDSQGRQVAERALAVEEGNGPKTVALVVSGPGGTAPTPAQLAELDEYFNGVMVGLQRVGGVLLANIELTSEAFTPAVIDVTATVSVLSDFSSGAKERIEAALAAKLLPSARRLVLDADGVFVESEEFLWQFGGVVSLAFLITTIATSINGITNLALSVPAADVPLTPKGLPVPGTLAITIVVV